MKRFLKKALRWSLIVLATLITLLLVFYAEEDWRGARDWAACQRDLAAKGETLDLRQLIPPGNPADDLSKVPIFAEIYNDNTRDNARIHKLRSNLGSSKSSTIPKTQYRKGEPVDLKAWQQFYRSELASKLPDTVGTPPQDVLQALSQLDPELKELDTVVSNPRAFFPIDYNMPFNTPLSGMTSMIAVAQVLQLKGVAHLENNQSDLAEKDYLFSFRLCQPLIKECFLVHYLVAAGVRAIDDSILWEGLRRHEWNEAQLREMESALASTNMLSLAARALRNERGDFLQTVYVAQVNDTDFFRWNKSERMVLPYAVAMVRPSGWWDQDRRAYSREIQRDIESLDLAREKISTPSFFLSEIPRFGETDADTSWAEFYTPLSALTLPTLEYSGPSIARAETYRRLARLACRLEEYRIAHGQYPDKLEDLPDLLAHLNQEVLSEQPLQYHRKGDGYQLYSLGWNQKDDGGTYDVHDPKQGDWPWPSP